jgi:hypothetical protein
VGHCPIFVKNWRVLMFEFPTTIAILFGSRNKQLLWGD